MLGDRLLTAGEAAAYLRVNVNTLRRYIRQHRIRAAKLGRGYRIRQDDLDAFLRSATEEEPPLTSEEIADSEAGWQEYLAGKGTPLDQVTQEQLHDRADYGFSCIRVTPLMQENPSERPQVLTRGVS